MPESWIVLAFVRVFFHVRMFGNREQELNFDLLKVWIILLEPGWRQLFGLGPASCCCCTRAHLAWSGFIFSHSVIVIYIFVIFVLSYIFLSYIFVIHILDWVQPAVAAALVLTWPEVDLYFYILLSSYIFLSYIFVKYIFVINILDWVQPAVAAVLVLTWSKVDLYFHILSLSYIFLSNIFFAHIFLSYIFLSYIFVINILDWVQPTVAAALVLTWLEVDLSLGWIYFFIFLYPQICPHIIIYSHLSQQHQKWETWEERVFYQS